MPDPSQPSSQPADDDPWADDTWDMPLPSDQAALQALTWTWGATYEISTDDGQWRYRRRDGKSCTETAATPDELHTKIILDHSLHPHQPSPPPSDPAT